MNANDTDLIQARNQNDQRLKSVFENIFAKYEKDFTDVGDEIDLNTEKIVVDNGHILEMKRKGGSGGSGGGEGDAKSKREQEQEQEEGQDQEQNGIGMLPLFDEEDGPDETGQVSSSTAGGGFDEAVAGLTTSDDEGEKFTGLTASRPGVQSASLTEGLVLRENGNAHVHNGYGNDDDDDDDDDKRSVDSLLDTAYSIGNDSEPVTANINALDTNGIHTPAKENPSTPKPRTSVQNNHQDDQGTVDPIWRVPDLPVCLSTPTLKRSPKGLPSAVRSASPQGVSSLWALPAKPRGNTDVGKKHRKEKPTSTSTPAPSSTSSKPSAKRKLNLSPLVRDWKFAELPDGNESDDPLQEYEPSPMSKEPVHHHASAEKRMMPIVLIDKDYCVYCKQLFSRHDYLVHLGAALSSTDRNDCHDRTGVQKQLAAIGMTPSKKKATENDSSTGQTITPTPTTDDCIELTPDQARLIMRMKKIHKRSWSRILSAFPDQTLPHLTEWHRIHWNKRLAKPPSLSRSWSRSELEKLHTLKDKKGLSWFDIQADFPGRSHAEVEYHLLRLWAGRDGQR